MKKKQKRITRLSYERRKSRSNLFFLLLGANKSIFFSKKLQMIGARLLSSAYAEIRWETGSTDWIIMINKQNKKTRIIFLVRLLQYLHMYMYVHVVVHTIKYRYRIGLDVNWLFSCLPYQLCLSKLTNNNGVRIPYIQILSIPKCRSEGFRRLRRMEELMPDPILAPAG